MSGLKGGFFWWVSATSYGAAAIIEIEDVKGKSLSSHQLGLDLFMRYLQEETGADVFLLGIQPRSTGFGEELCTEVCETIDCLEELFKVVLSGQMERLN